ncbi:MAG: hypothetical protein L0Y56_06240 [Nitrospira sp.]|nr:hypothetical protein [Nitrospira sp.]
MSALEFYHTYLKRSWKIARCKIRQALVDFIVWAWPIMPRRARLWAFMNDGPLIGDPQ